MKKSKNAVRLVAVLSALTVLCSSLSGCSAKFSEFTSFSMGSVLSAKIYTEDEDLASDIRDNITSACEQSEKALSGTDEKSEIFILNKNKRLLASDYLINTLMDIIMVSNILERKVDVSVGEITKLWGFTSDDPHVPDKALLSTAVEARDIEKILIDPDSKRITIENDISLDTGAFGKGAACDAVYTAIRDFYAPVIMSLGGTVMAYGEGPSDGKWTVGIRNPFGTADDYFATLTLAADNSKNAFFISTSGSYEKTFTENGVTYHHIIDPKSGYPVKNDLVSVTVLASSGLNADALSTALFVNGFNDDAIQILNTFFAEAVFVFSDSSCYVTEGLREAFELTDEGFSLKEYEK